jgi:hypothetical protein
MDFTTLQTLFSNIEGCTFATIDSETKPTAGIRCVTTGERVILFTNKKVSGYEQMVRRRLEAAGKNPDNFVLSDLPWGERIPNTPFITHNGRHYLQCIVLAPGDSRFFIGDTEVNPDDLGLGKRSLNQGLSNADAVVVHTYAIENITAIRAAGEDLVADKSTRSVLRLKI